MAHTYCPYCRKIVTVAHVGDFIEKVRLVEKEVTFETLDKKDKKFKLWCPKCGYRE